MDRMCMKDVLLSYRVRIKMFKMIEMKDDYKRYTSAENELLMTHQIIIWEETKTNIREKW